MTTAEVQWTHKRWHELRKIEELALEEARTLINKEAEAKPWLSDYKKEGISDD